MGSWLHLVKKAIMEALIGISGVLPTTPTMAINAILQIALVNIAGRCIKGPREGHSESLSHFNCIPDNLAFSPRTYVCTSVGYVSGAESLENRRSELFHGWIEV